MNVGCRAAVPEVPASPPARPILPGSRHDPEAPIHPSIDGLAHGSPPRCRGVFAGPLLPPG